VLFYENLEDLVEIAGLRDYMLIKGTLKNAKGALLSAAIYNYLQDLDSEVQPGDDVTIYLGKDYSFTLNISAVGLVPMKEAYYMAIYVPSDFLPPEYMINNSLTAFILVDVDDDYQISAVSDELRSSLNLYVIERKPVGVFFMLTEFSRWSRIYNFYGFIAAIPILFIVGTIHARKMNYDIAVLKARGLSKKGAISFIYLSISPILILSLIIGVAVGFITAYGLSRFFLSAFYWGMQFMGKVPIHIFPSDLTLIIFTVLIFIFSPLIPAIIVSSKKPIDILSRG
jgi:hypothetical protein